jgi:hypothetical protein
MWVVLAKTCGAAGTAITFDATSAVRAWTWMGLEVMTNQWGDYEFTNNTWTFRVEERITYRCDQAHRDQRGDRIGAKLIMKVTVKQGIRCVHAGTVYADGASADVPDEVARAPARIALLVPTGRGVSGLPLEARSLPRPISAEEDSLYVKRYREAP